MAGIEAILAAIPVVPVTLPVMRLYGEVDARLCAKGQRFPISDLLIACTALVAGGDVVTGNPRHFQLIPGLTVRRFP